HRRRAGSRSSPAARIAQRKTRGRNRRRRARGLLRLNPKWPSSARSSRRWRWRRAGVSTYIYVPSGQVHFRMVAQHQAQGLRHGRRPVDQDLLADQATLDADRGIEDLAVLEHDQMLDLAVADLHAVIDGCEGADVGVFDQGPLPDDGRSSDDAVDDLGTRLDHDLADNFRVTRDLPVVAGFEAVEHDAVGFEHVLEPAGVLPPARDDVGLDPRLVVHQPLNGVRDLELAAGGRLSRVYRVEDPGGEQVDADEGEVRLGLLGLLLEADDLTISQLGPAEALGRLDAGQQDERFRPARVEAVDEGRDAVGHQVVTEEHNEGIVLEEGLRLLHRMGEPERRRLADIGHAAAPASAVTHGRPDLGFRVAHDHADVGDPGRHDAFQRIEEDRFVRDRDQLFRAGGRDGPQA